MSNKLPKQPPKGPTTASLVEDLCVCMKAVADHQWGERNLGIVMAAAERVSAVADNQVALGMLRATAGRA